MVKLDGPTQSSFYAFDLISELPKVETGPVAYFCVARAGLRVREVPELDRSYDNQRPQQLEAWWLYNTK